MEFLGSLIIKFAFFLDKSKKYIKLKDFFRLILEYEHSKIKIYFDMFIMALVFVSVFFMVYEVKHKTGEYVILFENIVIAIFIIEYLLRVWLCSDFHAAIIQKHEEARNTGKDFSVFNALGFAIKQKINYMLTPLAIIDFLAILPSYRPLRILRLFLLFRLFKIFRYTRSLQAFAFVLSEKKFELGTLAIFVGFIIIIASFAMYIFEANSNPQITSFFDAVYWSFVTVSTVGYGDIVPKTKEGMITAIALILLGVAVLAFLTSIIVSAFNEKLNELKQNRVLGDIEKIKSYILICGYGRIGEVLAKMLHEDNEKIVIVDIDENKVDLAKKRGLKAICADASKSRFLQDIGIEQRILKIVCATGSDEMNIFITLTARSLNKSINIISRVEKKSNKNKFYLAGADIAFCPDEIMGIMSLEYIKQPIAYEAIDEMLTGKKGIEFELVAVFENSIFENKTIRDLNTKDKKIILFGVLRKTKKEIETIKSYEIGEKMFFFNPPLDFIIKKDDILVILGRKHQIEKFEKDINNTPFLG